MPPAPGLQNRASSGCPAPRHRPRVLCSFPRPSPLQVILCLRIRPQILTKHGIDSESTGGSIQPLPPLRPAGENTAVSGRCGTPQTWVRSPLGWIPSSPSPGPAVRCHTALQKGGPARIPSLCVSVTHHCMLHVLLNFGGFLFCIVCPHFCLFPGGTAAPSSLISRSPLYIVDIRGYLELE